MIKSSIIVFLIIYKKVTLIIFNLDKWAIKKYICQLNKFIIVFYYTFLIAILLRFVLLVCIKKV